MADTVLSITFAAQIVGAVAHAYLTVADRHGTGQAAGELGLKSDSPRKPSERQKRITVGLTDIGQTQMPQSLH